MVYEHREVLDEYLSYRLKFCFDASQGLSMVEVTLVAHEYNFSLDQLGKNIKLNSV